MPRAADGEVLLFLDGDTVPEPTYVEELAALPALLPDALVTGRRRHADLAGWTPERLGAWFAGGPAPQELTEPAWLREAGSLLDADDRSYRFVISAVMGTTRALFDEVGGFDETFGGYGGEDWELAHRLFTAGAVLAHRERAVAWHDGPDWGLRGDDPVAARREKNAETRSLARLLPDPAARGVGGWWRYPEVVVRMAPGADDDATVLGVRSVLAAGVDLQVWGVDPELLDGDPRVHAGEPSAAVLARARGQVTLRRPAAVGAGRAGGAAGPGAPGWRRPADRPGRRRRGDGGRDPRAAPQCPVGSAAGHVLRRGRGRRSPRSRWARTPTSPTTCPGCTAADRRRCRVRKPPDVTAPGEHDRAMTTSSDLDVVPLSVPVHGVVHRTFVAEQAGRPLRCCLRDSAAGERLALAAVSPPGPEGAYRETGPVFVHADGCAGPAQTGYPAEFRTRDQVFRAYGHDGSIVDAVLVPAGTGQEAVARELLGRPDVAFVHSRNPLHGCYMFAHAAPRRRLTAAAGAARYGRNSADPGHRTRPPTRRRPGSR